MDGNKDDAERCADIGEAAFRKGDFNKALKFLGKAQKLYPSKRVADLLLKVAAASQAAENGASAGPSSSTGPQTRSASRPQANGHAAGPSTRQRTAASGDRTAQEEREAQATPEMISLVARIKRTTNYYEILEVSKECTEDDVKKAYRKLALKLHPDKNKARGADEAFKAVSKAFQCLSDADLRANYDRYGHEDPNQLRQQQFQRRRAHGPSYDDFDPNDIFNAFFFGGGMAPNARVYRYNFGGQQYRHRAAPPPQQGTQNNNQLLALLQLLPVIAFLLYALMPTSEPVYSMARYGKYVKEMRTSDLDIPFWVKGADFEREYPAGSQARAKIERQVTNDYRDHLETRCYHERVAQQQQFRWGQTKAAREMKMPYCDELRRVQAAY
ncbi:DnaJ heat shock family protein [Klebsormidium nitens]|uniref:DnaJ heat shock family protein n=1 Tax=Klebsormidium nitens TaxID=105231 RepID=A0A1Y1HNY5_KLENI|nr:DnaJ heat shock family protein [Klebsormidium nitens]|eukprot:GAQ78316.1 DnaJ heat shock family protein [Klebsormidium nitens]